MNLLQKMMKTTVKPLVVITVAAGVALASSSVTYAAPVVTGSIFGITVTDNILTLNPKGEETFVTLDECWDFAIEFNTAAVGTGFIAVCWPSPTGVDA